jgi:hypothetical protein
MPVFPRGRKERAAPEANEQPVLQIDAAQLGALSAVFSAPRWLRDLGLASWLLVGVAALIIGLVWLLGATSEITQPVLVGFVVAAVASPLVGRLRRHGVPRAAGAGLVLLAFGAATALWGSFSWRDRAAGRAEGITRNARSPG